MDREEVAKSAEAIPLPVNSVTLTPLDKPKKHIVRSTKVVALMTLISRVLGFVRDMVLALIFGASPAFDAFVVAFKLPNFMRRLFAEGAFSQAFVPVLSEYRVQRPHHDVQKFINHIAGSLGAVLLLIVILAELIAQAIILVFAPGFAKDPLSYHYATHMLYITFPYLLLIAMTAFAGAALNTYHRFALAAFTPTLLNIVMILVAWLWAPHTKEPIYTLAWGVLIGGFVQLFAQYPCLKSIHLLGIPKPSWRDPGVRRVFKLMIPALFGVSVAQLSLLIDNFFASFLQAGSISWLYYSDRLIYFPQGVIGVALATVVLPSLSRHHAKAEGDAYSKTLDWALRVSLLVGLPAAIGLMILSGPILLTLIYRGAFSFFDVTMTTKSLQAFSIGLPAFMVVKILASGFYSRQNIKTPVKIAAFAMIVNLVFNLILVFPLAHAGLALSTSLASIFNSICLFVLLHRSKLFTPSAGWPMLWVRLLSANGIMAILLYWLSGDLQQWLTWGLMARIWHLVLIIVAGMVSYFVCLWVFGLRKAHFRP